MERSTFQTRKLWLPSRPTVIRVTFDLPEYGELHERNRKWEETQAKKWKETKLKNTCTAPKFLFDRNALRPRNETSKKDKRVKTINLRPLRSHSSFQASYLCTVITWNPESNCTCQLKNHSFPLKDIDVTRTTDTSLDVMSEKHIDDYQKDDGNINVGLHWQVSRDSLQIDVLRSGERLTRKQTTSRPDKVWPDMWKVMSDASKC